MFFTWRLQWVAPLSVPLPAPGYVPGIFSRLHPAPFQRNPSHLPHSWKKIMNKVKWPLHSFLHCSISRMVYSLLVWKSSGKKLHSIPWILLIFIAHEVIVTAFRQRKKLDKFSLSDKSKFYQSLNHNHGAYKAIWGRFCSRDTQMHLISHVKIYWFQGSALKKCCQTKLNTDCMALSAPIILIVTVRLKREDELT